MTIVKDYEIPLLDEYTQEEFFEIIARIVELKSKDSS